ncbi:MAG: hypothetical protein AB1798_03820 [Spirochaetota bacterium]
MSKLLIVILLCLMILVFNSCATTGFLGFLATTKYVENKVNASSAKTADNIEQVNQKVEKTSEGMERQVEEVAGLKEEIGKFRDFIKQLEGYIADLTTTKQATQDLQEQAKQLAARLGSIPRETIKELAAILEKYLEEKK